MVDGKIVYESCIFEFVNLVDEFVESGVRFYGGCCGINFEYIRVILKVLKGKEVLFESSI